MSESAEFELLAARQVPLSDEQRRETVGLLAELLVDVARKRGWVCSGGGFGGGMGGACGGVAPLPEWRAKARRAA